MNRTALRYGALISAFALGAWAQSSGLIEEIWWYRSDIVFLAKQHMVLVGVSGSLAIALGVPLGVLLSRGFMRPYAEAIMQVLNVGTTIPTLALLALFMSFLGIGATPAIFGLFVASILPIVRNTMTGLLAIAPAMVEAARGMGMRPLQILWQVELPNTLYVIFAGIRTAIAVNVGTAALAFLIGGGGLGELIFQGIDLNMPGMMLAGAIPTALLAIATDFLISQVQYWAVPKGVNPLR